MNSTQQNPPEPELTLPEKLAQAQAAQAKWSKVALDPSLSPEAAQVARNAGRSAAAISRLYQKASAYQQMQGRDDPTPPAKLSPESPDHSPRPEYSSSSAREWAEEHHRFLREANPKFLKKLRQSGSLEEHLRSVGEDAAEMFDGAMRKMLNSKEEQALPSLERVARLESLRDSTNELIRHDLIYWPIPEEDQQPYTD